jgi:transcriptional regulator
MYIPQHFRNTDIEELIAFIRSNSFGALISNGAELPYITHLPFAIETTEPLILSSHMAAANPHGKSISNGCLATIVFNGPHGYVSPSHYESKQNVPTWNYIAVHAHGRIEICSESEKEELLKTMIAAYEPQYRQQYDSLSQEYLNPMKKAIVAFRLQVEKLEGKFKLSQNKTAAEKERIKKHFEDDANSNDLAKYM